ncbi:MAG TPA: hypothetical protein VLY21_00815 [Nitrososphaerales archaeon]|nr:hypothetical protein [Nitrososphaerales archaeon]
MNTRMVVVGLIILAIGIALFAVGAIGALGSVSIKTGFSQPHAGEYVSAEIVLNSTSDVVVASPASTGGLIHAQDLSLVNSTNFSAYAIPINTTGSSYVYESLVGDYYYVAFASTQPGTTIVATSLNSGVARYGSLVLLGIVLLIVGAVVAVVGALRKKRLPPDQQA